MESRDEGGRSVLSPMSSLSLNIVFNLSANDGRLYSDSRVDLLTFRHHTIMHQYRPQHNTQQSHHRDPTRRSTITLLPIDQRATINAITLSARRCCQVDPRVRAFA